MKQEGMLAKTVKLLNSIKSKVTGADHIGEMDSSVLKVAMMISALDGDVAREELNSFGLLARRCRGFSAEGAADILDEGLRGAGYIVLQTKLLSEKRLVELFVAEAAETMPSGFAMAAPEDVRKAFVMWTVMAMADGEYSGIERKAIDAFRKHLDAVTETVNSYNESRRAGYAPAFSRAFVIDGQDFKFKSAATDEFLKKAEGLIARVGEGDAAASTELKNLIVKG